MMNERQRSRSFFGLDDDHHDAGVRRGIMHLQTRFIPYLVQGDTVCMHSKPVVTEVGLQRSPPQFGKDQCYLVSLRLQRVAKR